MQDTAAPAIAIYQQLLDDVGDTIVARDRAAYVAHFGYPHMMQTFDRAQEIPDESAMGQFFDRMLVRLDELGVRELTRTCTIAEFVDADTIRGYHDTRLINRAMVIVEGYFALSTLRRMEGAWKVCASQYAEPEPSLPTHVPRAAEDG